MILHKRRVKIQNRLNKGHYQGKDGHTSALSAIYRQELASNATAAEKIVREFLIDNNVRHQFQKTYIRPFHRIVDFYIPRRKIIIEIDGGYHKDILSKDLIKDEMWKKERGCKTIRITNEQVYSGEYQRILFLDVLCA
jgi:very-short-patch-repair endonuclease